MEIPAHIRFLLSKSVQKNAPRFMLQRGHFWIPLRAKNSLGSFLFAELWLELKRKEGKEKQRNHPEFINNFLNRDKIQIVEFYRFK